MTLKSDMTNIAMIADASGVSTATVSRVLSRSPKVAPETAAAVLEVVERLGYDSHAPRRGRPRKSPDGLRTRNVSLLFPDVHAEAMSTPLSGQLAQGVEEILAASGLNLMLSHLRASARLPLSISNGKVDGVIVRNGDLPQDLSARLFQLPVVWAFAHEDAVPSHDVAQPDNSAIGELALDYLLERGCEGIALVKLSPEHVAFRRRAAGFLSAAKRREVNVIIIEKHVKKEFEAALTACDGVFVPGAEKEIADCYRALEESGRKPVVDCRLIGCANDESQLHMLDPRLDNIDIQAVEVGRAAAELLLWRLKSPNRPVRRVLVPPKLTLRI